MSLDQLLQACSQCRSGVAVLCYSMGPNEHAPQRASAFMFIFTNNVIFAKNNYYTER